MAKQRDYKREDRHRTSTKCGVRLDTQLFELFKNKVEKNGTSMNAVLVKAVEDYVFNDEEE